MHQRNYASTVLRRADMYDCNPVITPAVPGRKYTKASAPSDDEARKERLRAATERIRELGDGRETRD